MSAPVVDPTFTALPYRKLADAALSRARDFNVSHADFRFERVRNQHLSARDGTLQGAEDAEDIGFAVRVIHQGAWGFASGVVLSVEEAIRVTEQAVNVAQITAQMTRIPVSLAEEPVYDDVAWCSAYEIDPFTVPLATKATLLSDWTRRLDAAPGDRDRHQRGARRFVRGDPVRQLARGTALSLRRPACPRRPVWRLGAADHRQGHAHARHEPADAADPRLRHRDRPRLAAARRLRAGRHLAAPRAMRRPPQPR